MSYGFPGQQPGPAPGLPWPGSPQPPGPGGLPPGPPRTPGTSRKALWIAFSAGLAAVAVAAGVGIGLGASGTKHPAAAGLPGAGGVGSSPSSIPSVTMPASSPSPNGSSTGTPPPPPACPSAPSSGPQHMLSFPAQIGAYQQALKPVSAQAAPLNGAGACSQPDRRASYSNSANDFFDVYAGYHGTTWTTYNSFWQSFNDGTKVTMFPAGTLGGQVGCIKLPSAGSICTWFDNDTFGEVVGSDPEPHTAAELNAFRAAIEHNG